MPAGTEHRRFLRASAIKAADDEHGRKIARAIGIYQAAVKAMKPAQFCDWGEAREVAAGIKREVLGRLPELLREFEKNAAARGVQVLWAEDADEARQLILEICRRHGVRKAVKSKSMTTEEIALNETLERSGVRVWETDLGELIVQLAGERPYHIVTPAMHKTKAEISELFTRTLGTSPTDSAEELTAAARAHLRDAFCSADLGITGANFLIADQGAVVLTENEGNIRLTAACPRVHLVLAGIEKILPRLSDLELFLPLLATSGTGQQLTCYNTIYRGARGSAEADGPEQMYIILLDNGRSRLYADERLREALCCIRCGACLNACPVYRTIGGHAYNTAYCGPIGAVITPQLLGLDKWQHLSFASSLCGACGEVCPVHIALPRLLLENRRLAVAAGVSSGIWKLGFKVWAYVCRKRSRLQSLRPLLRRGSLVLRRLAPARLGRRIPTMAEKSFCELWRSDEQQRKNT